VTEPERVIRITLDINILVSDIISTARSVRATASTMIVDAVRDGRCPAGPVQLITSLPIIEAYADVLQRRLGYLREAAFSKADALESYALDGAMPTAPLLMIGTGFVPFATEEEIKVAVANFLLREDRGIFNEIADDRYVLETAIAGRADILITNDIRGFARGPAIKFDRSDIVLFPTAAWTVVVCTASFARHWLWLGEIPDAAFIRSRPEEFRRS
jgi:hypothetical protein